MDTKGAQWSSLAEFLQSKKLSEFIPTFSTLNLQAFSQLSIDDVERHVSPLYDRKRVMEAVHSAQKCLKKSSKEEAARRDPIADLTPTKKKQNPIDSLKTPTGPSKHPSSRTPTKSALRPTKSLSPPMSVKSHGLRVDVKVGRQGSFGDDLLSEGSEEDCLKGEEDDEESNLVRLRHQLGSSDPELSSACKQGDFDYQQQTSYHRSRNSRRATEYRLSAGDFSPGHSPCPSPRTLSPSRPTALPNLTPYATARRWSVASSDYYSGSPSSLSSASSQERLYNFPGYRVSDEDVNTLASHPSLQRQHSHPDKSKGRPRARSLSPDRSSETSFAEATFYGIYKERFPQAKDEMEKKLEEFVEVSVKLGEGEMRAEANANFIHHRVTEIAKDILVKSRDDKITDTYFQEVSSTLDKLMHDSERTNIENLNVVKEAATLLKIISRTGRLLECLQFDASTFYSQLNDGPSKFDELLRSTASLPRYISSRLSTKFGVVECSEGEPSSPVPISSEDEVGERNQFSEDDFEQRKLISNGAYGEVFLVRHKTSKELFALKRIRKDRVIERSEVERAFMERDILSFVHNPFVVSMLCSFQTKTHLCMVLEYVEGGDVGTLLKNVNELDIETARLYHGETVLALEYIHSYGIVHRDLKPENLLITKEGHIKLTDFGLSRCGLMQMATRTLEHGIAAFEEEVCTGTPDYIAPEVIYQRAYGFSVDWWSMGIILYQFLVGCTPFHGDTMETLFENIHPSNIEWPNEDEELDQDAIRLIMSLLEMDPMARLGARGAQEVKEHEFYASIHWDQLMMHKAEFIPYLDSDEDTSYFDARTDRYDHSITEDSQKFSLEDSTQFKYFDTVNWSADHFSVIQHSPRDANRNRQASYDSVDSVDSAGTDNQPSISTDDGQGSNGEQSMQPFDTSTPVKVRPVEEEEEEEEVVEEAKNDKNVEIVLPPQNSPVKQSPVKKLDLSALISHDVDDIRTVTISKGKKGYGFVLQAIKVTEPNNVTSIRHLITEVDKCGSASDAGLIVGHLINECNNIDTHQLGHQQLVSLIREAHEQVILKVQHISTTSITAHRPCRKTKKKRRQNSFLKKASMVHGRAESSVVSMEKLLHLTRKTREKQNSDSDKSGGEDLVVRGQQIVDSGGEDPEGMKKHGFHGLRHKGCRRRTSSNFVAPVSPLARTPSPTNHMCYFTPEQEPKTPVRPGASQKTTHYPHPRSQSMSAVKDTAKVKETGLHLSPVLRRKMHSPRFVRKSKGDQNHPNQTHPASSLAASSLASQPSDSLSPINRSHSTRQRKKSWVSALEDKDSL